MVLQLQFNTQLLGLQFPRVAVHNSHYCDFVHVQINGKLGVERGNKPLISSTGLNVTIQGMSIMPEYQSGMVVT